MKENEKDLPSWSNSKYDIFNRCNTEYFFDKVVSRNGWNGKIATKLEREAYVLKNTRNRYAWSGDLIHSVIEEWIDAYKQGKTIDRDGVLQIADTRMREQYRESMNQKYRLVPKRYIGLVEHDSSITIPDSEWKEIHDNVRNCLINFFYSDFYKLVTNQGMNGIIKPERLDYFVIDNLKIYARPDVAIKTKHSIKLLDWKTGKQNDNNDLQMIYYALYAAKKFHYPVNAIEAEIVYLKDNFVKPVPVTGELINNAEEFIMATSVEMQAFEKQLTKETALCEISKAKSTSTCLLCRFQKLCRECANPSPACNN